MEYYAYSFHNYFQNDSYVISKTSNIFFILLKVLSDDNKRAQYDQFGQSDFSGAGIKIFQFFYKILIFK